MIETVALLMKKAMGVGMMGTVTITGIDVSQDALKAVKDFLAASASRIEMNECHKVIFSFYLRDNRYPQTAQELWSWFEENYNKEALVTVKTDGWFTQYHFLTNDYEIQCAGPDKKHDTRDDFGESYPSLAKR